MNLVFENRKHFFSSSYHHHHHGSGSIGIECGGKIEVIDAVN